MSKPKYRRPGNRKARELVAPLQEMIDAHASDPLVLLESVRDDGRGMVLRTWDLHGPSMEQILASGLEYEVSFATAKRPDAVSASSRLFTITRPEPVTVDTSTFGPVTLARSGAILVDAGTDGRPGHRLDVDVSGSANWERRLGAVSRGGCAGNGVLGIHGKDWTDYLRLSDAAWSHMKGPAPIAVRGVDLPEWLWVVVMRLGDEVRMRESLPGTLRPPPAIADLLQWMARCVEGWCVASECSTATPQRIAEPVTIAATPAPASPSERLGGGIGDAVARVRQQDWGPIIPPLKRGE